MNEATFIDSWRDHEGNGHLHLSAKRDDEEGVRFLLERGCDVNAENNNEQTPLSYANFGNPRMVEF